MKNMNRMQGDTTAEGHMVVCTTVWAVGEGGLEQTLELWLAAEGTTGEKDHKNT